MFLKDLEPQLEILFLIKGVQGSKRRVALFPGRLAVMHASPLAQCCGARKKHELDPRESEHLGATVVQDALLKKQKRCVFVVNHVHHYLPV